MRKDLTGLIADRKWTTVLIGDDKEGRTAVKMLREAGYYVSSVKISNLAPPEARNQGRIYEWLEQIKGLAEEGYKDKLAKHKPQL